MHALGLKHFAANPTSHPEIAQTWNLPNYRVERKKTLLILAFSLATHACHGRMRNVCWDDMGSCLDWDRLQSSPGELRHLNTFLLQTDTTIKKNKAFWIILIKKDYGENCLGNKRNRHPANRFVTWLRLANGSEPSEPKYALCLDILQTWF